MSKSIGPEGTITLSSVVVDWCTCSSLLDVLLSQVQEEFSLDDTCVVDDHSWFSDLIHD